MNKKPKYKKFNVKYNDGHGNIIIEKIETHNALSVRYEFYLGHPDCDILDINEITEDGENAS